MCMIQEVGLDIRPTDSLGVRSLCLLYYGIERDLHCCTAVGLSFP